MKHYPILLAAAVALLMAACASDNEEARVPRASVTVSSKTLNLNESMELRFTGVADQVVVYTGEGRHQYELRDSSHTGYVVNKDVFTYSYSTPGTFHVVCVASTYDTFLGGGLSSDTTGFYVTVVDDVNTINAMYVNVTPNVYYATAVDAQDWLLRLPTKQVYNNREMNVNAARQRLVLDVPSDSASVSVDGEAYVSNKYYNFTETHAIQVRAHSGAVRDYRLLTLIYPEFSSLTIGGETPTLSRSAYYQDLLTYTVAATSGVLAFTLPDDVRLYADGEEVQTGATLNPEAAYTLRRSHAENAEAVAETRVVFNITQP